MDKDTHVYCVHCKNLKRNRNKEFPFSCKYENECDFSDVIDSSRFELRPHYEPRYTKEMFMEEYDCTWMGAQCNNKDS